MKKTKRKANMISVALWVAALMVVGTVVIGKTAQYRKTKMVADKYTEAVRMMPALSNSIGVRLDSDKQHDGNVLLDFIGCYGVVLRDGSVMMAECDLEKYPV